MPQRSRTKKTHLTLRPGKLQQEQVVTPEPFEIDPLHSKVTRDAQLLVREIWEDKYRWANERSTAETFARVGQAVYQNDPNRLAEQEAILAMQSGLWMPGGRIIAGAGTSKRVTLMNCYVNRKMEDSLDDIMAAVSDAALTQQQGGGIGTDFSTLRPSGAVLHRTGAKASGPLPFMDMWHSMCSTIMSAGDRRGAMMGTLCDTHPDLPKFITAKQTKGQLTNFNVSVLVSDAFMEAVREDEDWVLHFPVEPASRNPENDPDEMMEYDFFDDEGNVQFAYAIWKARDLWNMIIRNTYEWSEPGIIFIDRINSLNNLKYAEQIHCTNPCGEQPLPPNGTCNLGAINLARITKEPFTSSARINWSLLSRVARTGVRFLDNVIDVTGYPLEAQRLEEVNKRRLGLGVSGLADCLAQLGLRYGSAQAVSTTEKIHQAICFAAYEASIDLAKERGPFKLFNPKEYLNDTFASRQLPEEYQQRIRRSGIRNGVLLTVAPTGTTSILYGNISSGIEPVFAHRVHRKVRQANGKDSWKEYEAFGYNYLLYAAHMHTEVLWETDIPPTMVTAEELTLEDHVTTQAAAQRWIDASVSKTINVPEKTSFEEFSKVYNLAYALGCKGCTTYRPSQVRGSILSRSSEHDQTQTAQAQETLPRAGTLRGQTHKVKWPNMTASLYITVNRTDKGIPFEVFFNSKDARSQEWMTALSLMISAILRKGGDCSFIANELGAVHSIHDTAWIKTTENEKPKFFGSIIAYLGYVLGKDLDTTHCVGDQLGGPHIDPLIDPLSGVLEACPMCLAPGVLYSEGCKKCNNCGYSSC